MPPLFQKTKQKKTFFFDPFFSSFGIFVLPSQEGNYKQLNFCEKKNVNQPNFRSKKKQTKTKKILLSLFGQPKVSCQPKSEWALGYYRLLEYFIHPETSVGSWILSSPRVSSKEETLEPGKDRQLQKKFEDPPSVKSFPKSSWRSITTTTTTTITIKSQSHSQNKSKQNSKEKNTKPLLTFFAAKREKERKSGSNWF